MMRFVFASFRILAFSCRRYPWPRVLGRSLPEMIGKCQYNGMGWKERESMVAMIYALPAVC